MRSYLSEIKQIFGILEKPPRITPIPKRPLTMRHDVEPVIYEGSNMTFIGFVEITEVKK